MATISFLSFFCQHLIRVLINLAIMACAMDSKEVTLVIVLQDSQGRTARKASVQAVEIHLG